eukprot:1732421-Rhodomonas_salina.1
MNHKQCRFGVIHEGTSGGVVYAGQLKKYDLANVPYAVHADWTTNNGLWKCQEGYKAVIVEGGGNGSAVVDSEEFLTVYECVKCAANEFVVLAESGLDEEECRRCFDFAAYNGGECAEGEYVSGCGVGDGP